MFEARSDGRPWAKLPCGEAGNALAADGVRVPSVAQCVERFGRTEAYWRPEWVSTWAGYLTREEKVLLDAPASQAEARRRTGRTPRSKQSGGVSV